MDNEHSRILTVSQQLKEELRVTIAQAKRVIEDSRRLIEESHILLEKAKRLFK
jgi:hypothetical protein